MTNRPPKKMVTLSKVQNIAVFGTRTYKFYVWYKSLDYFHASLNEIKNQNKWFSFVSICKHANFYFPSPMKIYLWLCAFYWFCDGTFIAFWSILLLLWCFTFISICKCNFVLQAISFFIMVITSYPCIYSCNNQIILFQI